MDTHFDPPRLIAVDDNICNTGGHYYELACLLLDGAEQLGYRGVLATNAKFRERALLPSSFQLLPTFHSSRLIHWSLGVDGHSRFQRNVEGKTIGGGTVLNAWMNLVDRMRPRRAPLRMLDRWADDLSGLLRRLAPRAHDCLLINTGDDFATLALAAALGRCDLPSLRIDVMFHFALYDGPAATRPERLDQLGRQIRSALQMLSRHDVHLHATTAKLAWQLQEAGVSVADVPYPTRPRAMNGGAVRVDGPWKIVLAGLPRAEKGKAAISEVLAAIEQPHLRSRRYQLSMQMPSKRWRSMIPGSLRDDFARALAGSEGGILEIMTNNLSPHDYHAWLDTADLGLFLYNPDRYVARCSGVLLEMMARGVPVIVPEGCWLADQVRAAGGDGSIGFIYGRREEIAALLGRYAAEHEDIRARSIRYAAEITRRHCGANTLRQMGLPEAGTPRVKAA